MSTVYTCISELTENSIQNPNPYNHCPI